MLLTALLSGTLAVSPLAFSSEAEISIEDITLGAVADLKDLPADLRARAEQLVLYPMPDNRDVAVFEHSKLASRARAMLPALSPWLSERFEGALRIDSVSKSPSRLTTSCGDGVPKGAFVLSVVNAGWFRVERKVEALQQGDPGKSFFVRTSDGDVTTVYCGEGS